MDDIGRLVLFRDVVEAGGFSRAAARRGLTHSTVSKHIKTLEAELGVRLLNRTSRAMSLTEAGRLVLETSREVGASVAAMRARLAGRADQLTGTLRISSLVHVGRHLVQPAVTRFVTEHPRVTVHLDLSDGPLHFTRDGLDLAVRVGLEVEGSLTASKLIDNDVCIVASPTLLERLDSIADPSDLARVPTVAYASGPTSITTWAWHDGAGVRTVDVDPVCLVNDGNALLDLVLAGVGVGYVSRFAAASRMASGQLVEVVPGVRLPPYAPVYIIEATTPHTSPAVVAFKRALAEAAALVHRER